MTDFIYEKDLTHMKLNILMCPFQRRVVDELSEKYDVSPPRLMKTLMENFDMSYLENLPSRYNSWKIDKKDDEVDLALGGTLFTEYVPMLNPADGEAVLGRVREDIESGSDMESAIAKGKEEISGMIWR